MRVIIALSILAVIVAEAASSFFVVDQTEYAVQMRFGEAVRSIVEPGLYVKAPFPVDSVRRFDNRLMILENPAPGRPDREYLTLDEQSGIGKNVVVTTYTCWRIRRDPTAVLRFLETMGDVESAAARIGDIVVSELGAALGRNDFSVLVSTDTAARRWTEFAATLREACATRLESAYGLQIVDVQIQRINFPEQNRRNVFERMRAERETIAARYRSEGEEQAAGIRAAANRQRSDILSAAYEESQRVRGEAEAEAARIYAEAYGQEPEFYAFMRTLEAYGKTLTQGTVAVLSGSNAFLKLLNRPADEAPPVAATPGTMASPAPLILTPPTAPQGAD